MQYGFFDDQRKEYVITTPKTPLPWINYLGNEDFFSLISNTSGGYSFYRDAKLLRLTRYRYNNCPQDTSGRYFYIKDGDTVWTPGWQPVQTPLDSYACRHGLGYTIFESGKNGISAEQQAFVPLGASCEINRVILKNTGPDTKHLQLFSFVEFCLWNAVDDASNYQRNYNIGEVETQGSCIYHKTEYRERRNHYAFFGVNHPIDAFDTAREAFCGPYSGLAAPQAVLEGGCTNSVAHGWAPVGAHQINLSLAPGESKSFIYILGYVENKENEKWAAPGVINKQKAQEVMARFSADRQVDDALAALAAHWERLLQKFVISSPLAELNRMVNIWNQYQCMVTFNLSRSASYFETGTGRGMGFRDSCQDILGFVHLIPQRARERILDIAATQLEDGSAYHQYQPLTKMGNADIGSGFNDDPLWLVACTSAYLRETGDFPILEELVPFHNDPALAAPLLEHLRRSILFTLKNLGPHGLPLIGRADWNDCLNLNCFSTAPGESFQTVENAVDSGAESVFIAGMFVKYALEYADICDSLSLTEESARVRAAADGMSRAALAHGWDGNWFLRAYDAFGNPVGSASCDEGQIYIEPQGMCAMAGIGVENGYAQKALASVEKYLDTRYGIMLLHPAYTSYRLHLGEISSYPPGYKENGSIFCHNNPWVSCAETVVGHGDRAFEIYKKTCPAYLEGISDLHRTEPYVYSQTIAGREAPTFGEAKNSWLTGTAAWTFVNVSQYILGIVPSLSGLRIDPCLPRELGQYTVTRTYRGAVYSISVENLGGVQKGVRELWVNGELIEGNLLPVIPAGETAHVLVKMG